MANIQVVKKQSVLEELEQLHQRIADRAFSLFLERNGGWPDPLADWLEAEHELVWKPAIEVREQDESVTVTAALPGVEPKDVHVEVTPGDVVIRAETEHTHAKGRGRVHWSEFTAGQVFRSVSLPRAIDTAKDKADLHNGILRVTAPIAPDAQRRQVEVTAA